MKTSIVHMVAAGALLVTGLLGTTLAQTSEVMYLADTKADQDGASAIYQVVISGGNANMVLVKDLPYNHADVIAAEPDGSKLWFVDDYFGLGYDDTGKLCYYDVATSNVTEIGVVTYNGNRMVQIDQAAMAPDGTLYIANNLSDCIYTLDKATAVATLVGVVKTPSNVQVNVGGADIAFGADGTFYLWINLAKVNAPAGLYRLELPAVNSVVTAVWLGGTVDSNRRFTGVAVRDNGLGDLAGSITAGTVYPNTVVVVDKLNGDFLTTYPMVKDGAPFDHTWGDMSTGPFPKPPETNEPPTFCTYTIGYWKNHTWNGEVVTVMGITVDETLGKLIMKSATSKNMSMLFAQLIAAKLAVDNYVGLDLLDDSEAFLEWVQAQVGDLIVYKNGVAMLNWSHAWPVVEGYDVKQIGTSWSSLLDDFNNLYHCEETEEPPTCPKPPSGGCGGCGGGHYGHSGCGSNGGHQGHGGCGGHQGHGGGHQGHGGGHQGHGGGSCGC